MSLNIPASPGTADGSYHTRPQEYTDALAKARALFDEHIADESSWEQLPEKEDVKLARKATSDDPYDVPLVKGVTTVESTTPARVLATIQLPGLRKRWDPRLEEGHPIARYGPHSYEFYSLMKSPSYFVWARDIAGVQENVYSDDGSEIIVVQTSISDDDNLPEAGSYAKSRTRATVDVGAWRIVQKGSDVELTYVVKVHLNGSIPTSVVSTIANETPMCCARVRDVHYTIGFHPYELNTATGAASDSKTTNITQTFLDDDDEKVWKSEYTGTGEDKFQIAYDGQRMYSGGVQVQVEGEGAGDVSYDVDAEKHLVSVHVKDGAKGKGFNLIISPK
ncbi:unnamed protein product [Parajaminaea phylloscopi]